jgi:hypothetical protein
MKAIRKVGVKKRRAAFVESAVSRWNRPNPILKRWSDLLEQMRVFLKGTEEVSMLEFARLVYLRNAAKNPEVGKDYAAISSSITLMNFLERWEGVNDPPLDIAELERVEREGLDFGKKGQDVKSK